MGDNIKLGWLESQRTGPWFNIRVSSYQYRKSHCGDKTVVRSSYLHNGISYTGKMSSLYWIGALVFQTMFQCYLEQHPSTPIPTHHPPPHPHPHPTTPPHDSSFLVEQVWIYNIWFTTEFLGQIWWKDERMKGRYLTNFSNAKSTTCYLHT